MRWPDGGGPGEPDFGDAIDEAIDRIQEPIEAFLNTRTEGDQK